MWSRDGTVREYVVNANEPPRWHCGSLDNSNAQCFRLTAFGSLRPEIPICVIYILPQNLRYLHTPVFSERFCRKESCLPRKTDSKNPADWLLIAKSDMEMVSLAVEKEISYSGARSKAGGNSGEDSQSRTDSHRLAAEKDARSEPAVRWFGGAQFRSHPRGRTFVRRVGSSLFHRPLSRFRSRRSRLAQTVRASRPGGCAARHREGACADDLITDLHEYR